MDGRLILQWLLLLPPLLPPPLLLLPPPPPLRQHAVYRQGEERHTGMGTDAVCV